MSEHSFVPLTIDGETLLVSPVGVISTVDKVINTVRNGSKFVILKRGRILKSCEDKDGYLFIRFSHGGKRISRRIHRLVAMAYIPNPKDLPFINHKDEDKKNNRVENLEWCDTDYNNHYNDRYSRIKYHTRIVVMMDMNENELIVFNSIKDASQFVSGNRSNIGSCCNGRLNTSYGHKWKFKEK